MITEMRFAARIFFVLAVTCGVMLFFSVMYEAPARECIAYIVGLLLCFGIYRHLLEQVLNNEPVATARNAFVGAEDDTPPQQVAPPRGGGYTYDPSADA